MKPMINLTESAARQIETLRSQTGAGGKTLRIFVEAGGCSGFEYGMTFAEPAPEDVTMASHGVSFNVDASSVAYLDGVTIHFDDGLHGKGFEFQNPNATATCGCGRSFS